MAEVSLIDVAVGIEVGIGAVRIGLRHARPEGAAGKVAVVDRIHVPVGVEIGWSVVGNPLVEMDEPVLSPDVSAGACFY